MNFERNLNQASLMREKMSVGRRSLVATVATLPGQPRLKALADKPASVSEQLVLTRFTSANPEVRPGAGWWDCSDRVMGGISNASLDEQDAISRCSNRASCDKTH